MRQHASRSLLWRVFLTNSVILGAATTALAVSPATVSAQPLASELVVLGIGMILVLLATVLLLRPVLQPLDALVRFLEQTRSEDPTGRVPEPPDGLPRDVARSVNGLLGRIEQAQRRSAAQALAAQENERARIAQDLHDGLGQNLTALVLEADVLAGRIHRLDGRVGGQPVEKLVDHAEHLREAARLSLDEVHRVARQLRPGVLEDLGLRRALASVGSELFAHSGIVVERTVAQDLPVLDEARELVIFRVAQEALTNVARHAGASRVVLDLVVEGDRVRLTVADDGRGPAGSEPGSGIRGMQERAGLVDGSLEIVEGPSGGTVVRLVLPVEDVR